MDKKQLFSNSLDRCCNNEKFFDLFYTIFMSKSRSIADKFTNTDFDRQKTMLEQSLYSLIAVSEKNTLSDSLLAEIATKHHAMDIGKDLYELWLESLLEAVEKVDAQWQPDIESAWREILQRGIRLMSD